MANFIARALRATKAEIFKAVRLRKERWRTRKLIDKYLLEENESKLHVGCGSNVLDGWLNADYSPTTPAVIYLDATKTFPFGSDTFNYIFSEHMIEHISYGDGLFMLREALRVLKPGGKIRISTPNLAFLIGLYNEKKTDLQERYIKWSSEAFIGNDSFCKDTFVINNYFYSWGHKFIYDESLLRSTLEKAGFVNVKNFPLQQSESAPLRNLENEGRMPAGFLDLETLTLEGTKGL